MSKDEDIDIMLKAKIRSYEDKIKDIKKLEQDVIKIEIPISEEEIEKERLKLVEQYELTRKILTEYLDLPEEYYTVIAIWIIGTYFHQEFDTYPYLFFNAMRGSGKSRALKLISILSNKSDGSILNNITESVLFRTPSGTTTCIDEMEQIGSKEKQTLRELLNSAYKKGIKVKRMKKVKEKDGENYIEESFEPYFPIAMANIWGLEEVLSDRSITLTLEKSCNPFYVKKTEAFQYNESILKITTLKSLVKCRLCRCRYEKNIYKGWDEYIGEKYKRHNDINNTNNTKQHNNNKIEDIELEQFYNKIDNAGFSGRNFELCFPLLITANIIDEGVFVDLLNILKDIIKEKSEEEFTNSKDVCLYEFIALHGKDEYYPIKDYTSHFRLFVGDTGKEEAWVNDKWVGRALKRLKLIKQKRREASGRFIIVDINKAKEKMKMFKTVGETDVNETFK